MVQSGLFLFPKNTGDACKAVVLSILGVTAFIVALDAWLFRGTLPAAYVEHFTSPLIPRMFFACAGSAIEEFKFRLIGMTALGVILSRGSGHLPSSVWIAIILTTQFINVGNLILADPLYASLRYLAVGSVWGWLYWRHGWLAALSGHATCHLLLDPLLVQMLR